MRPPARVRTTPPPQQPATRAPTSTPASSTSTPATSVPPPAPHLLFGGPDLPLEFPPPGCAHRISPEDARDKVLMAICVALARVENRALTPRQIVDVVHQTGIIKLGGNTPASTVSTHIRNHLARGTPHLLLRHSLQPRPRHPTDTPSVEDRAVGPSPDGSTERKKGTSWYLSEAAGFASPWDRLGIPTPKEPDADPADAVVPPSPAASVVTVPVPAPKPMDPTRVSSRKRTRTKSWSAAARELGIDGMSPPSDDEDESEVEAHRERKSKVRIRLRLGSRSDSRSSSVRPEDPQPQHDPDAEPEQPESDPESASCEPVVTRRHLRRNPPPTRNRVFSAPSSQFTHFRRSLSYASSAEPPTPHALTFVDAEDSDVEDGDFHVRMMCNSESELFTPSKSTDSIPLVGIGCGLVLGEGRRVVKEEHELSMSPPSLSSRASSLAASSLPEDDVWAVKIEEPEDVTMAEVALEPEPCNTCLGFELGSSLEKFEAEFALLGVYSPIVPTPFVWEPEDVDGPESLCADEVDGLWSELVDKRPHTRATRKESAIGKVDALSRTASSPSKRRGSVSWGCRAPAGMRVSIGNAKPRSSTEGPARGVTVRRSKELPIERIILHGVEYGSCIVRGCVLLRRIEGSYVSLTALLRACRVPGSCHAQFRTTGTVDVAAPAPEAPKTDSTDNPSPPSPTQSPASATSIASEPTSSEVIHTGTSSSEIHPLSMPLGASIDFGTGVEAADISGMWCPLGDARTIAEERLRPYLPEDVRQLFLADVLPLKEPTPEVEEPKVHTDFEPEMDIETEPKTEKRDETPMATTIPEKVLAATEDDVTVYVRPSSPATVPCTVQRRVLRARPARVARTRTRA
ncbi:hypothetical protein RhiLY_13798 [Ceratobasidium sp. AG-Ba]|nr:hypothetical protein RhiLY_13798 [Ceratobasidium sp. AG-Ba]